MTSGVGRLDIFRAWPAGFRAMLGLEKAVAGCDLERTLVELVETHVSQRNGCGFCSHRHASAAAALGVPEGKLADLQRWPSSGLFDARERAGLALTDALVDPSGGVDERLLERVREQFTPEELAQLVYVIATISAWNRLAIADATPSGPA